MIFKKMTWYDKVKIDNLLRMEQLRLWFRQGLISLEQYSIIAAVSRPAYKRSNGFIRAGMFILTWIIFGSSFGLFGLLLNIFDGETGMKVMLLLGAILAFVLLRNFIREKGHFSTGVDDALLYAGLMTLTAFVQLTFNHLDGDFFLFMLVTTLPILLIATVLFIDRFLAVMTFVCLITLFILLALKAGPWGRLLLPFMLMIAGLTFYLVVREMERNKRYYLWSACFQYTGYVALALFYLAGNYLVVREGNVLLMNAEFLPGTDIPFAPLFYAWTILVPAGLIYAGLKKKEIALLNAGLIFFSVSILSLYYYYKPVAQDAMLITGGLILILLAWFSLKYLRVIRNGITAERDKFQNSLNALTAESLVIAQSFGTSSTPQQQDGPSFGGGEFGGGGAGDSGGGRQW